MRGCFQQSENAIPNFAQKETANSNNNCQYCAGCINPMADAIKLGALFIGCGRKMTDCRL